MIKTLLLTCGYIEDTSMALTVVTHKIGFKTFKEAIVSLGTVYRKSYEVASLPPIFKECCKKAKGATFCPDCGCRVQKDEEPDPNQLHDHIYYLLGTSVNEAGGVFEFAEAAGWTLWLKGNPFEKPSEVIVVSQNAAWWLVWGAGSDPQHCLSNDKVETLGGRKITTGYEEGR